MKSINTFLLNLPIIGIKFSKAYISVMSASIHHSVDSIGSSINKDTSSAYSDQYISKLSSYSQKQFEYGLECVDEPDKNQDFSSVTKSVK